MKEAFVNAMITAIEGGSEYWCSELSLLTITNKEMTIENWFDAGFQIRVKSDENEEVYTVSHADFFNNIKAFRNWETIFSDEGDYDAEDADQFLQMGVFGEVIFG